MKTIKDLLKETQINPLQQEKQDLHEQKCENWKNSEPQAQNKPKYITNNASVDYNLKITIEEYDFPYSKEGISELIDQVEDFLLDHRNIKIEPNLIDSLKSYLFNSKYTPAQYSLAKLWIEKGAWPQVKRSIEISDFYPKTNQLDFAHNNLLTKEFAYKKFNALRTDYELAMRKRIISWKEENLDKTIIDLENENKSQCIDFIKHKLELKMEIDELKQKNNLLSKECNRLNAIILRKNENI
jgi:hypothetical protein